jgi:Rod binding domain-containing protein
MFASDASPLAAPGATAQDALPSTAAAGSADAQKLKKAAGDFESILLASMWKGMKQSFGTSEADADPAHGTLDDWGIEIMSGAVGKAGGLGIGKLLLEHLQPAPAKAPAGPLPGGAAVDGQAAPAEKK